MRNTGEEDPAIDACEGVSADTGEGEPAVGFGEEGVAMGTYDVGVATCASGQDPTTGVGDEGASGAPVPPECA